MSFNLSAQIFFFFLNMKITQSLFSKEEANMTVLSLCMVTEERKSEITSALNCSPNITVQLLDLWTVPPKINEDHLLIKMWSLVTPGEKRRNQWTYSWGIILNIEQMDCLLSVVGKYVPSIAAPSPRCKARWRKTSDNICFYSNCFTCRSNI